MNYGTRCIPYSWCISTVRICINPFPSVRHPSSPNLLQRIHICSTSLSPLKRHFETIWNPIYFYSLTKRDSFSGRIMKCKIGNRYHQQTHLYVERTILPEKAFLGHVHKNICNILSLFNAMNVKNVWRHRNLLSAVLVEEGVVELRWRVITLGCSDFLYPLFSVTEPEDILRRIEALLLIGDDELKLDRRVWKGEKKRLKCLFFLQDNTCLIPL